jgi:predicted RNase H-like HicB family nuclease
MIRDYIALALKKATYEQLEDGSYSGEIVECPGTIAFGETEKECREELESALEDWLLSALHHGDGRMVSSVGLSSYLKIFHLTHSNTPAPSQPHFYSQ